MRNYQARLLAYYQKTPENNQTPSQCVTPPSGFKGCKQNTSPIKKQESVPQNVTIHAHREYNQNLTEKTLVPIVLKFSGPCLLFSYM